MRNRRGVVDYRCSMIEGSRVVGEGPESVVRLGVLGCGNVGGALVELVDHDADGIARRSGTRLAVTRVAVRNLAKARPVHADPDRFTHDAHSVATDSEVDVVVELIGGLEPARTIILEALKAGKPVVTANKELIANFGAELFAVAESTGSELLFEGSVGGAIPLLRALHVSLAAERIRRIVGIVNGTTNFILSRMSQANASYAEALEEAQSLGYAERDPSADVEGFDASAKAAILAGIAFNADVVSGDVYREGIDALDSSDVAFAHRLGYEVKLLAIVENLDEGNGAEPLLDVRVHPTMIPVDHPLASVHGPFNAVYVEGDAIGEIMLYGRGAGGMPTASAVLGDVLEAARSLSGSRPVHMPRRHRSRLRPIDELRSQYYLTLDVVDRPGVLSAVTRVFGDHDVSIQSMEQVGAEPDARLVFVTHLALEADVQSTLAELKGLGPVKRIGALLRVVGPERERGST
ncbi:MAG: homoserine dehydrogenase [Acidimicrobiales bacterium]